MSYRLVAGAGRVLSVSIRRVVLHNRGAHRVQILAGSHIASALDADNHIRTAPGERCLVCLWE